MSCLVCFDDSNPKKLNPPNPPNYFTSFGELENYENSIKLFIKNKNYDNNDILQSLNTFDSQNNSIITKSNTIPNSNNSISFKESNFGPLNKPINFIHKIYNNISYPNLKTKTYLLKKHSNLKNHIIILHIINKCYDYYEKNNSLENSDNFSSSNEYKKTYSMSSLSSLADEKRKMTILFSHSSDTDLGKIFPMLCDFSNLLKCDIISYDYEGYGKSNGKPKISNIKNDIFDVINFCIYDLEIKKEDIILFGEKCGAIPSLIIASKGEFCNIRGIVLLSPDLNFGIDDNIFEEIICEVLIIMGKKENEDCVNEKDFWWNKFKKCIYWFSKSMNDYKEILDKKRYLFYKKIRKFIQHVKSTRVTISQEDFDISSVIYNEK